MIRYIGIFRLVLRCILVARKENLTGFSTGLTGRSKNLDPTGKPTGWSTRPVSISDPDQLQIKTKIIPMLTRFSENKKCSCEYFWIYLHDESNNTSNFCKRFSTSFLRRFLIVRIQCAPCQGVWRYYSDLIYIRRVKLRLHKNWYRQLLARISASMPTYLCI